MPDKKMRENNGHLQILVVLTLFAWIGESAADTIPSIEDLFRMPCYSYPSLSLDGEFLVAISSTGDQKTLVSYEFALNRAVLLPMTSETELYWYDWISNLEIMYCTAKNKKYVDNIGVVSRNLGYTRDLFKDRLVSVIDGLVHDENHAVLWFFNNVDNNHNIFGIEEVRIVNTTTGELGPPETDLPGRVLEWKTDMYGTVRLARVYRQGSRGFDDWYNKDLKSKNWRKLTFRDMEDVSVYSFAQDGNHLYVSGYGGKNTSSLYLYNLEKDSIEQELFNDPQFDFDGKIYFFGNPYFQKVVHLRGVLNHRRTVWYDSLLLGIQQKVDSHLKDTRNLVIDADTSLTRFFVESFSDIQPEKFYLFDNRNQSLVLIMEAMPWIDPKVLCKKKPIIFLSRDSLALEGFITYPRKGGPPYPAVVLPHGGPWTRDGLEFDPEAQFLATRGYAVLQINYRGSTGFGTTVSRKGKFDYLGMHRDVTDATVQAIRLGLIDSARVAIMGASFGGYLAICGAAFEPNLYKCAITNAGVFDWKLQWKHFKNYANREGYEEMKAFVSSQSNIEEFLYNASPIHKIGNIKIPVLIAGGRDDCRFPIKQSYHLERALKHTGNKPETYYKFGELHGFQYERNRVQYYEKVLAFLNKNVAPSK